MASTFTPNDGTAHECITSADVTITLTCAFTGTVKGAVVCNCLN
jgi:hypothetical protein